MDSLEILYDHYKETDKLRLSAMSRRNKNFVILCSLEALNFWVALRPELAFASILQGLNSLLDVSTLNVTNNIIQSFIWIVIIYVEIRYIQDTLYIERQYQYQAVLEDEISKRVGTKMLRESENYLENYPIVLNLIDLFYKMFCPILFSAINFIHIIREFCVGSISLAIILDFLIFLASIIIMWFYFFNLHSKISTWFECHCPPIKRLANILRNILKEV